MRSSLILWFSFLSISLFGQTAIQGKVKDADSEIPIEKVKLELYKNGIKMEAAYTDEYGNYSFSNIDPGNYNLSVDHEQYDKRYLTGIISFVSKTLPIHIQLNKTQGVYFDCSIAI